MLLKTRVKNLRELERILGFLEGEIRCRHSFLEDACINTSKKCGQPFSQWLNALALELSGMSGKNMHKTEEDDISHSFADIWIRNIEGLGESTCLNAEDMDELKQLGQTLGYLDIQMQEEGLRLEMDSLHAKNVRLKAELSSRVKLSVMLGFLAGILLVIFFQ